MKKKSNLSRKTVSKFVHSVTASKGLDSSGRKMVRSLGIAEESVPAEIMTVEFDSLGCHYQGIGVRNVNRGIQFCGTSFTHPQITLGNAGITLLEQGKERLSCVLFLTFMDYLHYVTSHPDNTTLRFSDIIIVNDWENFYSAVRACSKYENVYCCLPGTLVGNMMFLTIRDVVKGYCKAVPFIRETPKDGVGERVSLRETMLARPVTAAVIV